MTEPAPYTPATSGATPASTSKTKAVLSLVFGIVALLASWFLPIIWILLAIAGVILGFLSRRNENARGLATAGIIVSFIAVAANIASMVIGAIIGVQLATQ